MGRNRRLEDEHRRLIDHCGDRSNDGATLGLIVAALSHLLLGLLLALLDLLASWAALTALRFAGKHGRARQCRHQDREDQLPLHAAHVTTPRLNGK